MKTKKYSNTFYQDQEQGSYHSAKVTLPILFEQIRPKSVVDVGCGVGVWLKACQEEGVERVLGIEGEYVKELKTYIDKNEYLFRDLKHPLAVDERFDLAISLEVAEHLPASSADAFVASLCNLSDVILFSAAIVGQEGTYHINEQFPEYWAEKFKKHGYLPIDYIRPRIWNDDKVELWYRQNILIYVKESKIGELSDLLKEAFKTTYPEALFRTHQALYLDILQRKQPFHFLNYWWNKTKRRLKGI